MGGGQDFYRIASSKVACTDLAQDALAAPLIARISKKTKGTLQLLDLRAGCSEWGSPNEVIVH